MNELKNINTEISEIFNKKQNYDNNFNKLMYDFTTKAYELVDLSNDLYQIEQSIKLNKISLKDYILNSEICTILKNNNISNYSIIELKEYMNRYEIQNNLDITPYKLALDLYEKLEEMEELENNKINYEIDKLSYIFEFVSNIKSCNKEEYQNLYNNIIFNIKEKYLNKNIIDDKSYNYIIQILNDIFNYLLYGNKKILLKNNK